jgi:hypothetical protein
VEEREGKDQVDSEWSGGHATRSLHVFNTHMFVMLAISLRAAHCTHTTLFVSCIHFLCWFNVKTTRKVNKTRIVGGVAQLGSLEMDGHRRVVQNVLSVVRWEV